MRRECGGGMSGRWRFVPTTMSGEELGARYTIHELRHMLGSVGENVAVNRSVVFYSAKNIHVGSNVRIDCFCILSASSYGIVIGDNVHISAYAALFGSSGKIQVDSFGALSARESVFTATDDYRNGLMSNPTLTMYYTKRNYIHPVPSNHPLIAY